MADNSNLEGLANIAYNSDPMSTDSAAQALAHVACDSVTQRQTETVHSTFAEPHRHAEMAASEGLADMAYNGDPHRPSDMPADSTAQVLADMAYESVLQGPADMVHNVEPYGLPEVANGSEPCERTNGDYCEFQYIEIVPLDSPKEAAQTTENFSSEVKEEVKQEPEDVCNIVVPKFCACFAAPVLCVWMFCI